MNYESTATIEAKSIEGVTYTVQKMSFGRRLELTTQVRDLGARVQFLEAGGDLQSRLESALITNEIDQLYLRWGLKGVQGLEIDGAEATVERLLTDGPEELVKEIVRSIKAECGLNEDERKN